MKLLKGVKDDLIREAGRANTLRGRPFSPNPPRCRRHSDPASTVLLKGTCPAYQPLWGVSPRSRVWGQSRVLEWRQ